MLARFFVIVCSFYNYLGASEISEIEKISVGRIQGIFFECVISKLFSQQHILPEPLWTLAA